MALKYIHASTLTLLLLYSYVTWKGRSSFTKESGSLKAEAEPPDREGTWLRTVTKLQLGNLESSLLTASRLPVLCPLHTTLTASRLYIVHLVNTVTMDFSDIFRIVNLATGALMVLGGVSQFFPEVSVRGTICAIYIILFGLGNALLEFQIPPQVARYASFMFSFIGRGVCTTHELLDFTMT